MSEAFDVIVVGLGANGSAALYHLSKTGKKVLGIDRFIPPHTHGSSHGESRIIRQAYYEGPVYVPLLKAAYPLWEEIEKAAGEQLFLQTGGLMLGHPGSAVIKGSKLSAETQGIPYEYLDAATLQKRFPAFRPPAGTVGVLEKKAGILFPEKCIRAFLTQAAARNAAILTNETVIQLKPGTDKIAITTTGGTYTTHKLILSAGAWTTNLLPELKLPLAVKRQVLYWFRTDLPEQDHRYAPTAMPVYIWEYAPRKMFYGFPDLGNGIKIAPHHSGRSIRPDELTQDVGPEEISEIQHLARQYLGFDPVFTRTAVCMYTNTPDENFIIDTYPGHNNIIIASPCSGHGFKFSSLTGKILSDLALEKDPGFDLTPFSLNRPSLAAQA